MSRRLVGALTKEKLQNNLISLQEVLIDFEKFNISQQDFQKLLNGIPLKTENLKDTKKWESWEYFSTN